jgi:hypothetical protein
MSTCQKCGFELILLERKLKYKCALCSKLFPQKQIDNKTFRIWNQKQRELDKYNYNLEKDRKLSQIKKQKSALRQLFRSFKKNKEYIREWIDKNRDSYNETRRKYWNNNSERVLLKKRERYRKNRKTIVAYQKSWGINNPHIAMMKRKLADLRRTQKHFAEQICLNDDYKLYTTKLMNFLPTFLHSYLLIFCKHFYKILS